MQGFEKQLQQLSQQYQPQMDQYSQKQNMGGIGQSAMQGMLGGGMQQPGNPGFPDPYVQSQMDSANQAAMQRLLGGGAMGGAQQAMQQAYPSTSPMQQNTFMQGMLGGMQPPGQMSNMNSYSPRQMPQGGVGGFGGIRGMSGMMGGMMGGMRNMQGMMGRMRGPQATPTAMYAEGGLAGAAQNMAGRGRDGDSMLVHMSPGEVKGLQQLALAHGGSLSINPDTGLVEAGFLKNLLPMIAGAALMATGVGAPLAAGIVGGGTALATGDISKGLMAGLGAYGGAGLGQGLAAAGGAQAGLASGAEALGTTPDILGTTEGMTNALTSPSTYTDVDAMTSHALDPDKISTFADAYQQGAATPETLGGKFTQMGQGFKQLGSEAGRSAVYNALPQYTLPAAGASLLSAATPEPKIPGQPEEDERYKGSPYRYNLSPDFQGASPTRPNPYYRPTGLGYAEGGDVMMAEGGAYDDEPMGDDDGYAAGGNLRIKTAGFGDGVYRDTDEDTASLGAYDAARKRMEKQYGAANLKAPVMPKTGIARLGQIKPMASGGLGSYSDGGRMLKGPGDGMSDSIPGVIGNKQPARLADGEFVVPADVVSHLGNGSTDAGAKRLYSMMDKIRTARTGKKKQAPEIKTSKYMPA
jgi:hypothetical protein